jgi:hypothetical protein
VSQALLNRRKDSNRSLVLRVRRPRALPAHVSDNIAPRPAAYLAPANGCAGGATHSLTAGALTRPKEDFS